MNVRVRIPQLLTLLAIFALWFVLTEYKVVEPINLPPLGLMVEKFPGIMLKPLTLFDLKVTFYEFSIAYSASLVFGLSIGFTLGSSRFLGGVFDPILLSLYSIPIILFYPLCILLFGIGSLSKITFAALYGFFPLVINTTVGVRNTNRNLLLVSRSLGANWLQLNAKVIFPSALPMIMTGLRMGMIFSLIGVIAGEMIATSSGGLGQRIEWATETINTPYLYSYIILVFCIVFVVNGIMTYIERRLSYE